MKLYHGKVPKPPESPHAGESSRLRIALTFMALVMGFLLIVLRLVQLQVLQNETLEALEEKQFKRLQKVAEYRLPIFDRNGEEMAVSIPSVSIYARPREIKDKFRVAHSLEKFLGMNYQYWQSRLSTKRGFLWLKRQIAPEIAQKLAERRLPGIYFESENKRVYPNVRLASHVLGFTDIDGNGIAGMELKLNHQLKDPGVKRNILRDGRGTPTYISEVTSGRTGSKPEVTLTLDRRIQHILEVELEGAMEEHSANAALGIVMDPNTGEILAMGQRPAFDPNDVGSSPSSHRANRLISHRFEPGSTMKVIFGAEALQEGILNENSPIDCEGGKIVVGKTAIGEADTTHKFGVLPLSKVIRFSSNVGAVKIVQALGSDRVRACIEKFGISRKSGLSLPGEVSSTPRGDKHWTPLYLATVGFGQGISMTPLQMVAAFAPFANGGFWVRPRILMGETEDKKLNLKRVLSPDVAETMRKILIGVTEGEGGTGASARVPNIKVAGKTGTAQKWVRGDGYKGGKYFSSFIGFLPADKPELLIGVMVDEPQGKYYGSQVAGPLFSRVAERSLQVLGKLPRQSVASIPTTRSEGTPQISKTVRLQTTSNGVWIMPDLIGVSPRQAATLLGTRIKDVKIHGTGFISKQSPQPGTEIRKDSKVSLWLNPLVVTSPSEKQAS